MKKNLSMILIPALYLVFGVISIQTGNIHFDESNSHLPALELFTSNDPVTASLSAEYSSASTPLPYIIASLPLKLFNLKPSLSSARLVNIIISFICLIIFIKLVKKADFLYPAMILFFYPYFLKPSFAFFMSVYGLFFFLIFIYFILKKNNAGFFLGSLSLSLAILSQQFYLPVVFFFLYYLVNNLPAGSSSA